jgi:iron complex outermembrane receptor protein
MIDRRVASIVMASICGVSGSLGPAHPAMAQTANAQDEGFGLDEVTVTARRREESLQDTPVSVTAVTGELLSKLNITDVTRVAELAPNLTIAHQTASTTSTSIQVRGIGQTEPAVTAEQGVGLYLDGVYIARTNGAVFDLVDLERVEVLRGPQGTLFGRNTTGGAVQLVSRKPAETFGIDQKLGYGRFNDWYTRTRIDTGALFGTSIKAAIAYLHRQRDGYVDNTLAPNKWDPGAADNDAVWLSLAGEFNERLRANYSFDWNRRNGAPTFFQLTAASPDAAAYYGASRSLGGAPFTVSRDYLRTVQQASYDGKFDAPSETVGHSLTIEADINDALMVKSISAYRSFRQDPVGVQTGNGVMRGVVLDPVTFAASVQNLHGPYSQFHSPQRQFQYSEELQLLGSTGAWSYIAGAFYFYERASEYNNQRFTVVLPGGQAGMNLSALQAFGGETTSVAGFGQASYRPAALEERLELTAGVRYTQDDKEFWSLAFPNDPGDRSFSNLSWLASANYKFTNDIMAFGRVSTGYKAGGFSPRSNVRASFEPEEATAFEIGLKAEWFDRRLRTNLSIFQTDYTDLQVPVFASGSSGLSSIVQNAGEATFRGLELEMVMALSEGLSVDVAYAYLDPEYDTYLYRDPATNQVINVADQARFLNVAKNSLHVGAEYTFKPFGVGELSARLDWFDRGERYFFPLDIASPFNEQVKDPGTENLRARIALSEKPLGSGTWEVALWGDNLTDHANVSYGIDFGGLGVGGVTYTEPRRYGVDFRFRF